MGTQRSKPAPGFFKRRLQHLNDIRMANLDRWEKYSDELQERLHKNLQDPSVDQQYRTGDYAAAGVRARNGNK